MNSEYSKKPEPPKYRVLDSERALEDSIVEEVIYRIEMLGKARLVITNCSLIQREVILRRVKPRILEYIKKVKGPDYKIEDLVEIQNPTMMVEKGEIGKFIYDLEGCLNFISRSQGVGVEELFNHIPDQ